MIPVLTAQEMFEYEAQAVRIEGVGLCTLMERAARHIADAALRGILPGEAAAILIGAGNNGGDGLAALRMLHGEGVRAFGILAADPARLRDLPLRQYRLAQEAGCTLLPFGTAAADAALAEAGLIVDALFGTGLSREITGRYAEAVDAVNRSGARVLAVDIPSGVSADTGRVLGCAVQAGSTVTFQYPKRGLYLFPGRAFAGEVRVRPIASAPLAERAGVSLLEEGDVRALLPPRPMDSHKGKNGRALLIAGCEAYAGAALLAAAAALRAGSGILTACVPGAVKPYFRALPQAICIPVNDSTDWNNDALAVLPREEVRADVIALGPGGGPGLTREIAASALGTGKPLVLDADGLNLLARERELASMLHARAILTPHAGEMARLMDCGTDAVLRDPIGTAQAAAKRFGCCVLLKGATTAIADGGQTVLVAQGNPGLAKGGSGDMLTGLILGLLAQGVPAFSAACAGAYLLGATADTALRLLGSRMLMSGDLLDAVRETISEIQA